MIVSWVKVYFLYKTLYDKFTNNSVVITTNGTLFLLMAEKLLNKNTLAFSFTIEFTCSTVDQIRSNSFLAKISIIPGFLVTMFSILY